MTYSDEKSHPFSFLWDNGFALHWTLHVFPSRRIYVFTNGDTKRFLGSYRQREVTVSSIVSSKYIPVFDIISIK